MLTSVHSATDVRIFHKEAASLASAGHDVTVIGPHPANEVCSGIRIVAVPQRKRRPARMLLTPAQLFLRALENKADVYHFHDPELIPLGVLLRALGKRVIYDIHEYTEEDIATKHWLPPAVRVPLSRLVGAIERWASDRMNGVITVNEDLAERVRHAVSRPDRVVAVYNYPQLQPAGADTSAATREPVAVYAGLLTHERGWQTLLEAGKRLKRTFPGGAVRVLGALRPSGVSDAYRSVESWPAFGVEYAGVLPHTNVPSWLRRAQVGVIPWLRSSVHELGTPVKIFEYMLAGLPVVASDLEFIRRIVSDAQCGILVPPGDSVALAEAVELLLCDPRAAEEMGERGRQAVLTRYSWATQVPRMLALYAAVAGNC